MSSTFATLLAALPAGEPAGAFTVLPVPGNTSYYAGRDSSGAAVLLIKDSGPGRMVPLLLAGIEVRFSLPCRIAQLGEAERTESLTAVLCLARGPGVEDYFARIIDLLLGVLGPSPDASSVAASINELVELFQKLRRPPRKPITGLVGELLVIAAARDPSAALLAWRSDPDERYDFASGDLRIEAKASSTGRRTHFLSAEQANPPSGIVGLLASTLVERAGGGTSVRDYLALIEAKLASTTEVMRLRTVVAETLGRDLLTSLDWTFDVTAAQLSLAWFDLQTIPAVRGPFPRGVSGVRFASDLDGCPPANRSMVSALCGSARGLLPF